jgi:hypothetical protein
LIKIAFVVRITRDDGHVSHLCKHGELLCPLEITLK